ncbi:MAG: 3'-5' exonuclease [Alphaproteobacteria bacterium]|nr:3'-5' exonuclease [Alphaproteobacteria bacterium SS10]
MPANQRRAFRGLIAGIGLSVVLGVVIVGTILMRYDPPGWVWLAGGAFTMAALLLLAAALVLTNSLFNDIERLRGDVMVAASGLRKMPPSWSAKPGQTDELIRLADAVGDLGAKGHAARTAVEERLNAILATLDDALLVVTATGVVSLFNHSALARFGDERLHLGASVFVLLQQASLMPLLEKAAKDTGSTVACDVGISDGSVANMRATALTDGGYILVLPGPADAEPQGGAGAVEHDMHLHDATPVAVAVTDDTPLGELPILVLDCETTGLNTASDRMVSVGAIRLHGTEPYPQSAIDLVVNPGQPIPSLAASVHGITDALVVDAPVFADIWPLLAPRFENTILVGHHIGFDIAIIERELRLAGLSWTRPPSLDTAALHQLVHGGAGVPALDDAAADYQIDVFGRHSALGDALVTAKLYGHLVEDLKARDVKSWSVLLTSLRG